MADSGWIALLFAYCGQGVLAFTLSLIFQHYYRIYQRNYLRLWSLSFLALGIYAIAAGYSFYWASVFRSDHPLRLFLSGLALMAVYPQVAWLMLGTWELARKRVYSRRFERVLITALALFGLVSALAFAFNPAFEFERLLTRVGFRYLAAGSAFLIASAVLLRAGVWQRGLGPRMVISAFTLYGLLLLLVLTMFVVQTMLQAGVPWARHLILFDVLAQALIGLGLVIWLLEEERARVDRAAETIARLSYFDPLTGLANRSLIKTALAAETKEARVKNTQVAVLFIDLDRFRLVNESRGTRVGDGLLLACAERIKALLPPRAQLARLDADEFVVVYPDDPQAPDAEQFARRVLAVLGRGAQVEGQHIELSASIGIAVAPEDGSDTEELLRNAEMAQTRLKSNGGNNYQFFARSMNEQARLRSARLNEVRHALHAGEFILHYQPVVSAATKAAVGFEALVRWQHPTRGLLGPEEFLPALGELHLLRELDSLVLTQAAKQIKTWRIELHPRLYVSVNISAYSFQNADLVHRIEALLKTHQLPANAIELEITESAALANLDIACTILNQLNAIGVSAAIDDFGLGYSSFNYLRMLPVKKVKLDQSSVRDLMTDSKNAAIVAALIPLAHSLDLEVVAEGVETREQQDFLIERGVRWLQGFRYYRPMDAERCAQVLGTDPGFRLAASLPK